MEIRAYNELYMESARNNLGNMFDFAIVTLGIDISVFEAMFKISSVSKHLASGNPAYVCGRNGCELARMILDESGMTYTDKNDVMYIDKSPEYWSGWALAFYQWYRAVKYSEILSAVKIKDITNMYAIYHEMDIMKFVDEIDRRIAKSLPRTNLRTHRERCNLSQSKLADLSGVSLRQIQLFEQRQRDINKTQAITLLALSKALHCSMEDLMEPAYFD